MTMRKGLGKGTGSGYKNMIPTDPRVHRQSACGIKQPQSSKAFNLPHGKPQNLVDFSERRGTKRQVAWAFSILSDAQELINMGLYKEATEKINSAKRVLMGRFEYLDEDMTIRVFSRDEIRKMKEESDDMSQSAKKVIDSKAPLMTEQELNLVKRRLNDGTMDVHKFWEDRNSEPIQLTEAQNKKGYDWLKNLWVTPTGKEREMSPFGYREEQVMRNFDHIEVIDFYDMSRTSDFHNYVPLYSVVAKDGSAFDYYYDPSSDYKVAIVG
jgi:hypothetical protein